ncbi:MAG TPA: phosphate ABC transporter substrate-binding protein PstS [Stellaceae bacterium]|nr:phosphate ABC transporter substrate-binding protein PstS [Stellaceae bacterium]
MKAKTILMLGAMLAGLGAVGSAANAAEISGAGATFPYPIYAKWAEAYKAKTGVSMNYQSIGSGGGIQQIKKKTVNFGASDAPLKPAELDEAGLTQFPMIMGGIVPVVNLPGVKPGEMKLTGPVLADIFLGKVAKWNDPAIAKLNPSVKLPDQAIAVVHRSDGSGTTYNFADYLAKVSPEWKDKVGVNTSVEWPVGLGGKGNEGVSAVTSQTAGSIGYVEYAYALQNKMTYALMGNKEGNFVAPNAASFQSAAANADWKGTPGYALLLTDQPGKDSWPITASSFILVYKKQDDVATAKAVLDFFAWSYANGAKMAEELDYVPMPAKVVSLVEETWKNEIKGADGKPIWTGPSS